MSSYATVTSVTPLYFLESRSDRLPVVSGSSSSSFFSSSSISFRPLHGSRRKRTREDEDTSEGGIRFLGHTPLLFLLSIPTTHQQPSVPRTAASRAPQASTHPFAVHLRSPAGAHSNPSVHVKIKIVHLQLEHLIVPIKPHHQPLPVLNESWARQCPQAICKHDWQRWERETHKRRARSRHQQAAASRVYPTLARRPTRETRQHKQEKSS